MPPTKSENEVEGAHSIDAEKEEVKISVSTT